MKAAKKGNFRFNKYFLYIIPIVVVILGIVFSAKLFAEQLGSSPDSGANSHIKDTYDSLASSSYGSESSGSWGDWGSMWNRIRSAATWTPVGTATVSDVVSGKTFYSSGSRDVKTGTKQSPNSYEANYPYSGSAVNPPVAWSQTANGGTPASVTDNGITVRVTSNVVYRDPFTGLYWSDKSYSGMDNEASFAPGDDRTNPTGTSCNYNSVETANQYCDNQDPSSAITEDNDVSAAEFCLNLQLDADNLDGDNNGLTGTETDWRLPTSLEIYQLILDGGFSVLPVTVYWTSTPSSAAMTSAVLATNLGSSITTSSSYWSSSAVSVICVRGSN